MGHDCRICGRTRPNGKFSGKGHRTPVCKDCAQLQKPSRDAIVLDVAQIKPFKTRRLHVLARERRDPRDAFQRTGLIAARSV